MGALSIGWPELVGEYEPIEILLGMPVDLAGRHGPAAQAMTEVADRLVAALGVALRVVDERLSTANAARKLAASGGRRDNGAPSSTKPPLSTFWNKRSNMNDGPDSPAGTPWRQEGKRDDESIPR